MAGTSSTTAVEHQAHLRCLQPCGGALNLCVQLVQQLALHQGAAAAKASGQPTTTNKQPALMCPARTRATWLQRSGKPWQAAGHSLQTHVAGQPAVLSPSLPQHLWNSPAAPHLQVQLLPHLLAQLSYPHHMVAQLVQVLVLPPAHKRRLAMERKCAAHRQRRKAAA